MKILTVAQGYPEWVAHQFFGSLERVGFDLNDVFVFNDFKGHICSERMYAWLETVKQIGTFERVMLTDFRDVVFQGNPEDIEVDTINFYLENTDYRIKDEPYNRSWILEGWGQEGLDLIGDKPISCAGVIIGRQYYMLEYLKKQCNYLDKMTFKGADQGIHNWMIHTGEMKGDIKQNNGDVYTVGLEPGIRVDKHTILHRDGSIPKIVHQFDRHITLV